MPKTARCGSCGADLGAIATRGFCTACLLETGLSATTGSSRAEGRSALGTFGEYELLEEIARGGMGVVYKARQTRLDRTVALKMILAGHLASVTDIQRFLAEARTVATLHHPNIVAIHEVGEHDGQHFFSMDYVEGLNLAQLVRENPLPAARAARYVKIVAEAVHYAHQHGVLHRDLKPSNVLVDATDQPRVTDFGLAKRLDDSQPSTLNPQLTLTGQVLGSPNFMPPEQAAGRQDNGPASDVYSLGAILYHLLTGRPPFLADSMTATLRLVAEAEPTPPRLLVPTVPHDLETITLKCLEKDPRRRYASASELAEELGCFLRDEPILARPASRVEKLTRWCRRHPALASVSALACLLMVAIVAVSTTAAIRLKAANGEAREKLRDSYLAQARANRWSGRAGRRFDSLDALQKAADIRPSIELRNEAIAAMTLVDFRPIKSWNVTPVAGVVFDGTLSYYAVSTDTTGLKEVVVRQLEGNREVLRLAEQNGPVLQTAFFGDGRWFSVLTERDKRQSLKFYDVARAKLWLEWSGHVFTAWDVSRDGTRLALFLQRDDEAERVTLWDLPGRPEILAFETDLTPRHVRFRPDGQALALGDQDHPVIEIRNTRDGALVESIRTGKAGAPFEWSYDGAFQAAMARNDDIHLWQMSATGSHEQSLQHGHHVIGTQFNHRGDLLASVGWNNLLRLWNPQSGTELLSTSATGFCMGAFSFDDSHMLWWEGGARLQLCELSCGRECDLLRFPEPKREDNWTVLFSPDSRQLVLANSGSPIVWHQNTVENTAWSVLSKDMPKLRAVDWENQAAFGMTASGLVRSALGYDSKGSVQFGIGVAFGPPVVPDLHDCWLVGDPAERRLIVDANSTLRVLDAASGRELSQFGGGHQRYTTASSPDGRWLATWTLGSKAVRIWDVGLGRSVRELAAPASALVFSPDSRCLVTGSGNEYVVWSTANWRRVWTLPRGATGGAHGRIAFSADGRTMAVTMKPESIRLCEAADGSELATLEAPVAKAIIGLVFRADGHQLLALTEDGVRVWQLRQIRQQLDQMHLDWRVSGRSLGVAARDDGESTNVASVLVAARDESCAENQIDLTRYYNGTFDDFQFFTGLDGNDLATLPQGCQTLGGTAFDVRGVIQLSGHAKYIGPAPPEVTGIRVHQSCRALIFLHACLYANRAVRDATVGEYAVHYTDGRSEIIPLKNRGNIGDWWDPAPTPPPMGPGTGIAWRGANAASQRAANNVVLYKFRWENPHPAKPIAFIDFRSSLIGIAPFLIAITAE